jgi:hypothetical protein
MRTFQPVSLLLAAVAAPLCATAAEVPVAVRSDFPGGNVLVVKNEGATIELAPDLRGGKPWFYWNFEARASRPGRVTFVFAGSPIIGIRGPAVSIDEGRSWQWLGAEHVTYAAVGKVPPVPKQESFTYDFTAEHLTVRFAVGIPYVERDLHDFLRRHEENRHLTRHVLTRTRTGSPVELLQIGECGPGRTAMLVTARHHACEALASYVLEGFLEVAMADSPAAIEFRKKYVLFAVPLVDKDGVQAGDQGKNRSPHDHNRDYGPTPLYPEIQAIQALGESQQVRHAFDLHCPALRGDVHEAFHFLGLGPPHIKANVNELIAWLKEERPQVVMAPLNFLTDPAKPGATDPRIFSHHFALREGSVFAATLEVPYTQAKVALDAAMARRYGAGLLRAWTRADFAASESTASTRSSVHAELLTLRTEFGKLYRGKPVEAEAMTRKLLDDRATAAVLRIEAEHLTALLRLRQQRYAEAERHCEAALGDAQATTLQRDAATLLRLRIAAADPASTAEQVRRRLEQVLRLPDPANEQLAGAFEVTGDYSRQRGDFDAAIGFARRQLAVAATYEQGKVLNRIAADYDAWDRPDQAVAAREEAVRLLKPQFTPKPQRSVFGAMMVLDHFDAVSGIPTSSRAEFQAAAELVLSHDVVSAEKKDRVRKFLADMETK